MTVPIVTATDERYLPGAIALYNSYLEHSQEGFSFHVLAYGDKSLKQKLEALGINVILNPSIGAKTLPMSYKYDWYRHEIESSAMYARLIVPDLFPGAEYSIWVDADAIILKPLDDLLIDMTTKPVGCTEAWDTMDKAIGGCKLTGKHGIMSAFIVFNHRAWIEKEIYKKCLDLMHTSKMQFHTVVQGVLQYILQHDYHKYPKFHQVQGGHASTPNNIKNAYFLHFCGTNPWEDFPQHLHPVPAHKWAARKIWKAYA